MKLKYGSLEQTPRACYMLGELLDWDGILSPALEPHRLWLDLAVPWQLGRCVNHGNQEYWLGDKFPLQ